MNASPSHDLLVEQRVRNRIIEWLEMLVVYESDPPPFDLNEVLNQWNDWNPTACVYPAPIFTSTEADRLRLVALACDAFCSATPSPIRKDADELLKPEWAELVSCCQLALHEILLRGKFSEDFVMDHKS